MGAAGFALEVSNLHWLEAGDPRDDLCAHGSAYVRIGEETLVTHDEHDEWTLSAGSLYLLRTLHQDHTPDHRVGEHLIPCCGFNMWIDDQGDLLILGCPNGVDWGVRHPNSGVKLESPTGASVTVSDQDWRDAVLRVADAVRAFYRSSPPRRVPEDEASHRGYEAFWSEWDRLREAAL